MDLNGCWLKAQHCNTRCGSSASDKFNTFCVQLLRSGPLSSGTAWHSKLLQIEYCNLRNAHDFVQLSVILWLRNDRVDCWWISAPVCRYMIACSAQLTSVKRLWSTSKLMQEVYLHECFDSRRVRLASPLSHLCASWVLAQSPTKGKLAVCLQFPSAVEELSLHDFYCLEAIEVPDVHVFLS